MRKKGENHSDPIYTNPIKNLPKKGALFSISLEIFNLVWYLQSEIGPVHGEIVFLVIVL